MKFWGLIIPFILYLPVNFASIRYLGNPEEWGSHFEGDIKLTQSARNGLKDENTRWKNGEVPYEFHKAFDESRKRVVFAVMKFIEDITNGCIKFVKRTNQKDYVYFIDNDEYCWSYVGKVGRRQEMSLPQWCIDSFGSVLHEFLHMLGFFHEQARPNRDDYITVQWENIKSGNEENFEKGASDYVYGFGEPYDYRSIMHYSAYAFSKGDGKRTIVPKDLAFKDVIGQRYGPSATDIKKLKKMYKCH